MFKCEKSARPGKKFSIIFRGALIGFALGLLLAVLAGAWAWLEMRFNAGLLIPAATIFSASFAYLKKAELPYAAFLAAQAALVAVVTALYGFNMDALREVPAHLFREGIHASGLKLGYVEMFIWGILITGNLLWIAPASHHRKSVSIFQVTSLFKEKK